MLALRGSTPSRYLLNVARVILMPEQFNNGYLPDFRGNKIDRVPIPEETVKKLRGLFMHFFLLIFIIFFRCC